MTQGYILLHRSLKDNARSSDPKWMSVVVHMLLMASHSEWDAHYNGSRKKLKPGQFITGARVLGERAGVQKDKVISIWNDLEADQMIQTQRGNKHTLITFVNWKQYQNPSTPAGTQTRRKPDRNKEGINKGNKEVGPTAEEIYAAYPRKVGKANAIKAIDKALKKTDASELIRMTELYAQCERSKSNEDRKYTPHPATWFNGERYNDDPKEWVGPNGILPTENAKPRQIGGLLKCH
jgi:DNA-binding transcriptional regulator YhcF (GntR family)